jgi:hypothetical protein
MNTKNLVFISFILFLSFLMLLFFCPDQALSQGGQGMRISGRQSLSRNNMIRVSGMTSPMFAWGGASMGRLGLRGMTTRRSLFGGSYNTFAGMSRAGQLGNLRRMSGYGYMGMGSGYMSMGGFRGEGPVASGRLAYGLGSLMSGGMRGLAGIRIGNFNYGSGGMLNMRARRTRDFSLFLGGTYGRRKKDTSSIRNLFTYRRAGRMAYQGLPSTFLRGSQGWSLNPYLSRTRKRKTRTTDLTRRRELRLY